MMEAEEFHTEAINNSEMSERETNNREMSENMAEATHSDSGLMIEEFHSEAINMNNSDTSEIVVEENYSYAEIVAEQNHNDAEIVAGKLKAKHATKILRLLYGENFIYGGPVSSVVGIVLIFLLVIPLPIPIGPKNYVVKFTDDPFPFNRDSKPCLFFCVANRKTNLNRYDQLMLKNPWVIIFQINHLKTHSKIPAQFLA